MASWTPNEDQVLRELYETNSRQEILSKFPYRNWKSIYKRSVILGLFRSKDDAWKKDEEELLRKLYPDTPKDILVNHFPGRSWKALSWHAINILRITRTKEIVQEETRKTNQSKLGVDYPTQSAEVRDKVQETVKNKYGVDNVFQSKEIKEKIIRTNLEKYGVENPNQNKEIRQKTETTNLEKYGVKNPFELREKVRNGMLNKYGETCPLHVPEIKAKQQATNIERYGFPFPSQNPVIKEKLRKILNSPEVKEKKYMTLKNKENFSGSKEEDDFYIYLKNIDPYTEHHVLHPITKDTIDYYMPNYDLWIQYDGAYWHGKTRVIDGPQAESIKRVQKQDKLQNESIPNLIRFGSEIIKDAIKKGSLSDLIKDAIEDKIENIKTNSCHQYKKRNLYYGKDLNNLPFNPDSLKASNFDLSIEAVSNEIITFIEKYEWLGTIGVSPKWCFTARYKGFLGGVVLINEPSAYSKILGNDTPKYEALIQRGASASWTPKNLGSRLIMFACRWMANNTDKRAFVGYADLNAQERGIIYRACNFDYLGNDFGVSEMFKHPSTPRLFTSHSLKRTSSFCKWCRENSITPEKSWFKKNGFKNLETIPADIKNAWYDWGKKLISESEKIKVDKKLKYTLILGRNKRETKILRNLRQYKPQPYPNDSIKRTPVIRIRGITKDRKNPAKEQFLVNNYGKMTTLEMAKETGESPRWVKRVLKCLSSEGKIIRIHPHKTENILSFDNWDPKIKDRSIILRTDFLKSSREISIILEKEFGFKIGIATLNFWFRKFNISLPSKKNWLKRFLTIEKIKELKNKNYKITDFVEYLKNLYGVYISDDMISLYLRSIL